MPQTSGFGPCLNWDAGLDGCSVWLSGTALMYIFVMHMKKMDL